MANETKEPQTRRMILQLDAPEMELSVGSPTTGFRSVSCNLEFGDKTNGSYTIRKSSTPEAGYVDTYRLLEDGAVVGDPINIPTGYSDSDAEEVVSEHDNSINSHKDIREYVEVINTELEKLHNYDDAPLRETITAMQRRLDTLLQGDVDGVIDAFNEIEAFLHGITEFQTLTGLLADLRQEIVAQIPTDTLQLTNGAGYMTAAEVKQFGDGRYDPKGATQITVAEHNASIQAHADIREAIQVVIDRFTDYYTRTQTYTKEEVNTQIAALSKARFEVVEVLPEAGETNVIYLLSNNPTASNNAYDEYIYIAEAWEMIGTTQIDLSQYAPREWVQALVSELGQQISNKADAIVFEDVPGSAVSLDVLGGRVYLCEQITALTISTVENAPRESVIRFRTGAAGVSFNFPVSLGFVGDPRPRANASCEINIASGVAVINWWTV